MDGRRSRDDLLGGGIELGRVAGIPIGLHYSWFIIAALITFSLAAHFRTTQSDWSTAAVWGTALVTAVLFFLTLLAHELSHALVARARGVPVRSITLFALGGVAQIERDANTARTEFLIAIVGPLASVAIGVICIAIATPMGWSPENGASGVVAASLGWLGSINILLALFNLLPGYPLDGGRVLRAALWGVYRDGDRATRHAARTGQAVAGLLIGLGLYQFFAGAGFGGLWLAFIGWFLLVAAQANYAQVAIEQSLRGVRVGDVMASDCVVVDEVTDLQSLVDDVFLQTGRRCVIVESDGRVAGLITPHEVRTVDRARWRLTPVREVMLPFERLKTVTPDSPVTEAFSTMARENVNQLPVVSNGRLRGIITRGHIIQLLQSRSELAA